MEVDMNFTLTARHFKAHDTLKEFAEAQIEKLTKYYDGIIKSEIILSFDKPPISVKYAEVIVKINNHHTFTAKDQSEHFELSIEKAVEKVEAQIKKYKDKLKPVHTEKIQSEEAEEE
jgi:putative sigma-54 modulation protein